MRRSDEAACGSVVEQQRLDTFYPAVDHDGLPAFDAFAR
jgi:hypothetical protein